MREILFIQNSYLLHLMSSIEVYAELLGNDTQVKDRDNLKRVPHVPATGRCLNLNFKIGTPFMTVPFSPAFKRC